MPGLNTIFVLQANAVANGNGAVADLEGYDGTMLLLIENGAGTATLNVEGSLDNFATAQDIATLGVTKLWDSGAGVNTTRTVISGALTVAANTSYMYAVTDKVPFMRGRISAAATLGAGTNVTGLSAKLEGLGL